MTTNAPNKLFVKDGFPSRTKVEGVVKTNPRLTLPTTSPSPKPPSSK